MGSIHVRARRDVKERRARYVMVGRVPRVSAYEGRVVSENAWCGAVRGGERVYARPEKRPRGPLLSAVRRGIAVTADERPDMLSIVHRGRHERELFAHMNDADRNLVRLITFECDNPQIARRHARCAGSEEAAKYRIRELRAPLPQLSQVSVGVAGWRCRPRAPTPPYRRSPTCATCPTRSSWASATPRSWTG